MVEETKTTPASGSASARPANCMKCNKRLQRKVWYYRNRGYYCSKRCWKLASNPAKKEA